MKLKKVIKIMVHGLGISTVITAFIIELLIFHDIIKHGHFRAVENNPVILTIEVFLAIFGLIYFIIMVLAWKPSVEREQ